MNLQRLFRTPMGPVREKEREEVKWVMMRLRLLKTKNQLCVRIAKVTENCTDGEKQKNIATCKKYNSLKMRALM